LKIQHALKETSYLTDGAIFAISAAIATTIGNFFWAASTRPNRIAPPTVKKSKAAYGSEGRFAENCHVSIA
jgi:hypothetical protein